MKIRFQIRARFIQIIALGLLGASAAQASQWGPYFEVTAYPVNRESNTGALGDMGGSFDGNAVNTESGFSFDLRNTLGVKPIEWLLIGGTYNYGNSPLKRDATDATPSLESSVKNWEAGPTLGFFLGNWRIVGSYLLAGKKTYTTKATNADGSLASDEETVNKLKSGYMITVGYSFSLSANLKIGPTLSYRMLKYKSQSKSNALDGDPSVNYTDREFSTPSVDGKLLPMVTIALNF
ncbi:MAG: hypothetical protein NDJ89_12740 [Oligoflexia bacterium]|nr:hypothetical protein [Oligoflexia bacterium]